MPRTARGSSSALSRPRHRRARRATMSSTAWSAPPRPAACSSGWRSPEPAAASGASVRSTWRSACRQDSTRSASRRSTAVAACARRARSIAYGPTHTRCRSERGRDDGARRARRPRPSSCCEGWARAPPDTEGGYAEGPWRPDRLGGEREISFALYQPGECRTRRDAQLRERGRDVLVDGFVAQVQARGDLAVGPAVGDQIRHFSLAWREAGQTSGTRSACVRGAGGSRSLAEAPQNVQRLVAVGQGSELV